MNGGLVLPVCVSMDEVLEKLQSHRVCMQRRICQQCGDSQQSCGAVEGSDLFSEFWILRFELSKVWLMGGSDYGLKVKKCIALYKAIEDFCRSPLSNKNSNARSFSQIIFCEFVAETKNPAWLKPE